MRCWQRTMARTRRLEPGFFTDDDLADCEPLARILFAGLWTIADRDGRLKDRPRKIKAEVLPYDECDVDDLLRQLVVGGLIVQYEVDGLRLICIPTWTDHQTPHIRERASTLPRYVPSTNLGSAKAQPRRASAPPVAVAVAVADTVPKPARDPDPVDKSDPPVEKEIGRAHV